MHESAKGENVLDVVFVLDITGSMGSQIGAVRSMVANFCTESLDNVRIRIVTFDEDANGCRIDVSRAGLNADQLFAYAL